MKKFKLFIYTFILAFSFFCNIKQSSADVTVGPHPKLKTFFTKHCNHGGHYCLFTGGLCWCLLRVGEASTAELSAGDGNIDGNIIIPGNPPFPSNIVSGQLHLVLQTTLMTPPSLVPDTTIDADEDTLSSEVAKALGCDGIILTQGNYKISYSNPAAPKGEVFIDAKLIGVALVPTLSQWSLIVFGLMLISLCIVFIRKKYKREII